MSIKLRCANLSGPVSFTLWETQPLHAHPVDVPFVEWWKCGIALPAWPRQSGYSLHRAALTSSDQEPQTHTCIQLPACSSEKCPKHHVEEGWAGRWCKKLVFVFPGNCWLEDVTVFYPLCVMCVCCRSTEVYWSHFNKLNCLLIWHLTIFSSVLLIRFFNGVLFFCFFVLTYSLR